MGSSRRGRRTWYGDDLLVVRIALFEDEGRACGEEEMVIALGFPTAKVKGLDLAVVSECEAADSNE